MVEPIIILLPVCMVGFMVVLAGMLVGGVTALLWMAVALGGHSE